MATPYEPGDAQRRTEARGRATTVTAGTLTVPGARLKIAAASSRGPRHAINEDCHSTLDRLSPVYVVADGVGGGAMASRASAELVTRLHHLLDQARIDADGVRNALLIADREIALSIARETDRLGAATVALCASAEGAPGRWLVAWVGDCRVYRSMPGLDAQPELVTRDDSYRNLSELPPSGGSLDDPARMIGNGAVAEPNVKEVVLDASDMLVLSSDGLHKHVQPQAMQRLLRDESVPLPRRCTRLLALARLRGSTDDASVLVIHRTNAGNP